MRSKKKLNESVKRFDLIVAGGGIVGLSFSLLAAQLKLKIALIEKGKMELLNLSSYGSRVFAISHASQRLFQNLNVWNAITRVRVSPYRKIEVWDVTKKGQIVFDAENLGYSDLGHIIEHNAIYNALLQKVTQNSQVECFSESELTKGSIDRDEVKVELGDTVLQSRLLVGADGGNSWVRELAQIPTVRKSYMQEALVATVQTSFSNQQTAFQKFLHDGSLAFLPLSDDKYSSIVWATSPKKAAWLMSLSKEGLCSVLEEAFDSKLGQVSSVESLQKFSLSMHHAEYVCRRVALIGDAAHTLHPLAGQGLNLGLMDAASLAEVLQWALEQERDISSLSTLRRFERRRKGYNDLFIKFVDGFKLLFLMQNPMIKLVRNLGLSFIDNNSFLKKIFVKQALGDSTDLPKTTQ